MFEGALPIAATFSKDSRFWSGDPEWHPKQLVSGHGGHVWGDDGCEYIDLVSALGACLLGVDHPVWSERVRQQVWNGAGFSLPHVLEAQAAEKLTAMLAAHVPGWLAEDLQVRWTLGGSEACDGAVMLARAVTGRRRVYSIGYHGWHPIFTGLTPPAHGVVPDHFMTAVPYGDIDALSVAFDYEEHAAAVIIEQPPQDVPEGYWGEVRALCDAYGTLLICDEVVTGFRLHCGGAAALYAVPIDIGVYGKAIANGLPLGAIVAPREYMRLFEPPSPVFVSATGAGNAISLAAADAVLDVWDHGCVDHLWQIGYGLMAGLRGAGYDVSGQPPRSLLQFASNAERGYFLAGMRDRGILINRPNIPNLAHTLADVAKTVAAAAEVKAEMARIDVAEVMRGKEPCVLFENR